MQSAGEQFGQNWATQRNLNPGQDLSEGTLESAVQGMAVGGLTGGAFGGLAARHHTAMQQGQQAEQHAARLLDTAKMIEASKLRERDPQAFGEFMQSVADENVPEIFVDANALIKAGNIDEIAKALPSVAAQIQQAAATGGDVVIPTGELLSAGPGGSFMQSLIDHARTSPEAMSAVEAREYMQQFGDQVKAGIEKTLQQHEGDQSWQRMRDQVQTEFKAQLDQVKRFTSDVNQNYANLLANFYSVTAAKLGITPQELVQRYGLQVQAKEAQGGQQLDQGPAEQAIRDAFHALPSVSLGAPVPLSVTVNGRTVQFIARQDQLARGKNQATIHLTTLKRGRMLKGYPEGWVQTNYKLDGKNNLVPEGMPRMLTDEEAAQFHSNFPQGATLAQEARGSITLPEDLTKSPAVISLFKGADLSTFIHESGHFFLEVQADLAARIQVQIDAGASVSDGERSIVDDMNKLLTWFGVKGDVGLSALDTWSTMTLPEKRASHEQFARGFEAYAFEGEAPSIELQGVFQKFRAWMLAVYKNLKALNVELNDDVRGVMDRMLASTAAIQEAEAARSMGPLFATPEQAGMTPDEFAAYNALATEATQTAVDDLQARGLRDMKWLNNARGRKLKELQKQADELRRITERGVRAEVFRQPIYQAWQALTAKQDGVRFNTQMLKDAFGQSDAVFWRPLINLKMTNAATGIHHDMIAEQFGFSSGDELIQTLLKTEPPASVIEGMTAQRMLERHGDLGTPEGLSRAADRAIHNEARARFVATEIRTLEKGMKVREQGPSGRSTVDVLAVAARQQAEAIVARTRVRDLRPGQYTAAEVRAARNAEKAMLAGKTEEALAEKRHQIINIQAAKATMNAQDEVAKTVKYLGKFDSKAVRSNLPADYLDQIDMLLEKFDLSQQSGAAIDRTVALRTWVQSRLAAGEIPAISESLLAPAERRAYEAAINARDDQGNLVYPDDEERIKLLADAIQRSQVRPYQTQTVEELRGLRDTIKQIEHLGRLKDKLLTARDGQTYAATRDALVNTLVNNAKQSGKNTRTDNTLVGSWLEKVKQFGASHIKVATWARIFDGGQDNGAWWSTIIRPANERASFETTRRAEATSRLMDILSPVLKDVGPVEKIGSGKFFPEIGTSLNWEERFAIACNFGNESNLQRLMGGGIAPTRTLVDQATGRAGSPGVKSLTMPQVQAVLRSLSAAEWQAVQGVWDHFETYRPEIAAKEMRVNGTEPEWVAPRPFDVQTSDGQTLSLRGGYYPVVFDSRTSLKAQQHNDAQAAKDAMKAAYSAATTQRSFTKARVEEVTGRPLLLNLQGLYSGTNDVIHDLAWHEWVIDMNKLMRSQAIDEAIREHYGADVKKELTRWRDDIVAGTKRLDHGIENAAGWVRRFTSSAALTYNVMSAILQPLGITQSFSLVGTTWVAKGIGQYLSGPIEATQMVKEKSEFMRNRGRTLFRDINELRNRVDGQSTGRELMGRYGYYLTMQMQQTVDVPTWIGGYEKAIAAGHDEAAAIALADQGVKDSQGGGEEVDQAGITRGGPMIKLFTAFYDFMNTQANVLYLAQATSKTKAEAFMHFAMVGVATPILAAALKAALTPGDSGDWDDWEHVRRQMIREGLANMLGMVAFGREFTGLIDKMLGTNKGMSYTGPTGLRIIPDAIKLADQAAQGEMDDAFRKSFLSVIGDLSGIPAVQTNRTITGAEALSKGDTNNPAALVFGYQHP